MSEVMTNLVIHLHRKLVDFYGLQSELDIRDHILEPDSPLLTPKLKSYRAATIVDQHNDDTLHLGIHLDQTIRDELKNISPLISLSSINIDTFCVVAEEVSHFTMLTQRAINEHPVSHLELEFQGEIDKVLLASLVLYDQLKHNHWQSLVRLIFDCGRMIRNEEHYEAANRYAAKFWHRIAPNLNNHKRADQIPELKKILRDQYHRGWQRKKEYFEQKNAA